LSTPHGAAGLNPMTSKDEQVRAAIAEQASEWFVANDEEPLGAQESAALVTWLKASPLHVEEFLGVAAIARDLRVAGADPEESVETVLRRARAEDDRPIQPFWWRVSAAVRDVPPRQWQTAAATMAAFVVVSLGLFLLWNPRPIAHLSASAGATALSLETRHGEQLSRRLADESVLHLDTDSAVTIRYGKTERLVELTSGQAAFEVAHEPGRPFRVVAGPAEVVALGTKFNVRLEHDATVVTVVEGRVVVAASPIWEKLGTNADGHHPPRSVQVNVTQQIRVAAGEWPVTPVTVDAQRTTSWLHRQITFEHEPLARVAAEFNRYARKPIEITTPDLRDLEISGVFATDDSEAFIAFLRSLEGVRVEVTATRILVSQK
jgi:transmembrane sensor